MLILTSSYNANLTSTTTISRIQLDPHAGFGPPIIKNVKHKSIYAVEAYAQSLRDGTLSYVVEEIPYLNILLVQYPDIFAMVARDATTNGFGFVCDSCQNSSFLSLLFYSLLIYLSILDVPERFSFGS